MTELFVHILKGDIGESEAEEEEMVEMETEADVISEKNKENSLSSSNPAVIKKKIQFMASMLKMHSLLREEQESIILIKNSNEEELPQGMLAEGKKAMVAFSRIKNIDLKNESIPEF